jgi:signal transduction histidine kinase
MNTGALALGGAAAALAFVSGALGRRVIRLRGRLRSLDQPLHELRGALAAIELGLSFVERSRGVRPELNGCTDSLHVSLDRAALAAQDISILRVGEVKAIDVKVEVDLGELVLRSARAWSFLSSTYEGSVEVDWRAGPVQIAGHATRLQQALDNLIANALEHGGSRVLIEGERRGQVVRLLISDGGGGLPQDLDAVLAEKTEAPSSEKASSRGHGLAIVSNVIRDHQGRLTFGMSSNGPGLLVELPVAEYRQQGRGAGEEYEAGSANGRAAKAA